MSYYAGNYYKNPVPYRYSDIGEPVPGWGTTVSVAGPARLGVGATFAPLSTAQLQALRESVSTIDFEAALEEQQRQEDEERRRNEQGEVVAEMPWWVWIAVPVVAGGGLALAYNMGWIGKG